LSPEEEEILDSRQEIEKPPDPELYTTLKRLIASPHHRLLVSLGGGSVAGIAGNIALLVLLEELDLRKYVGEIWGTSAGAMIGGGWATGTPAPRILDLAKEYKHPGWIGLSLGFSRLLFTTLLRFSLPDGFFGSNWLAKTIDAGLQVKTFEDCLIPFRCIACSDDGEARRKVFREGPLLPAIRASLSLPVFMLPPPPPEGETTVYYDGGMVEKTPLISPIAEHLRSGDPRKLVILATHFGNEGRPTRSRGFLKRILQVIDTLENKLWDYQLAEARNHRGPILLLLNPHLAAAGSFDISRLEAYYLQARKAFMDALQNAKIAMTFGSH
jgi:predicted acylesterase/phospholipase RssA